jgi:50S ribosomal subunit-associated GTPase HflX
VSAARGEAGVAALRARLLERAHLHQPLVELRLDHANGKLLAELHRTAEVTSLRHTDDATYVTARMDAATLSRATRLGAALVTGEPPPH